MLELDWEVACAMNADDIRGNCSPTTTNPTPLENARQVQETHTVDANGFTTTLLGAKSVCP